MGEQAIPSAAAQDLFLRALAAYHAAPVPNLGEGRNAAGAVIDAALDHLRQENQSLRDDLRKLAGGDEFYGGCEGCGAALLLSDDYVSSEDGVDGCWNMMVESPPADKPCFAYRVGKPSAAPATRTDALADRGESE